MFLKMCLYLHSLLSISQKCSIRVLSLIESVKFFLSEIVISRKIRPKLPQDEIWVSSRVNVQNNHVMKAEKGYKTPKTTHCLRGCDPGYLKNENIYQRENITETYLGEIGIW